MLDFTRTSVARTICLELEGRDGSPITEVAASAERMQVASFLNRLYPGQTIEYLGRPQMLQIRFGQLTPSSLFFQAVHYAYSFHHALGLRPEVLMYLIDAVVAETVRRHPQDYRDLFTTQIAAMDINVRNDALEPGNPDSPWDETLALFEQELRQHVPSRVVNQMLPEFTTTTPESQIASLIAFMDAASPYYNYHSYSLCGIPRVVLFGEPHDWRRLHSAATELSGVFQKHLAGYFSALLPVLDTIATTAETGRTDAEFWGRIYKHYHASGSDYYSGWLSSFLWYVQKGDWLSHTKALIVKDANGRIDTDSEPCHVSHVPFKWHTREKTMPMHFVGGVLGVDLAEGALAPVLGYGVLEAAPQA
jgi:hypothetical protein